MITLTIDFTEHVENLSLTITDIDKNTVVECPQSLDRRGRRHTWARVTDDRFTVSKGANVMGAGTARPLHRAT